MSNSVASFHDNGLSLSIFVERTTGIGSSKFFARAS
jgi:hypothetical protein